MPFHSQTKTKAWMAGQDPELWCSAARSETIQLPGTRLGTPRRGPPRQQPSPRGPWLTKRPSAHAPAQVLRILGHHPRQAGGSEATGLSHHRGCGPVGAWGDPVPLPQMTGRPPTSLLASPRRLPALLEWSLLEEPR